MEVTIEEIESLLDRKLEPVHVKLTAIEEIVGSHSEVLADHTVMHKNNSTMLDSIARDVKTLLDDSHVTATRLDRLEHWAEPVGKKLGMEIDL